jgi:isoquinoline 1-oxidoreductase alpha subunit
MITLTVNGKLVQLSAAADTPLLWALRDELGYTGTRFGCGVAVCGACTVHVDGKPTRACSITIEKVADKRITTIEAMASERIGQALQTAWIRHDVPQCGYCQSGQIMSAAALLASRPQPTDAEIDQAMRRNLCRCGTYNQIRAAIRDAATALGA